MTGGVAECQRYFMIGSWKEVAIGSGSFRSPFFFFFFRSMGSLQLGLEKQQLCAEKPGVELLEIDKFFGNRGFQNKVKRPYHRHDQL